MVASIDAIRQAAGLLFFIVDSSMSGLRQLDNRPEFTFGEGKSGEKLVEDVAEDFLVGDVRG